MSDRIGTFVGIDWSSGRWVAVVYDDGDLSEAVVEEDIGALWDDYGETAERMVIDVPIGLPGPETEPDSVPDEFADHEDTRDCDALARDAVDSRASSVFPVPARPVVEQFEPSDSAGDDPAWEELNDLNKQSIGKGLPRQSAAIAPGIAAVDELLDGQADDETLIEGHPEVAFRALNGDPLEHSKKTALGVSERERALQKAPEYDDGDWVQVAEELDPSAGDVGFDDLLDALSLVMTAMTGADEWHTLPEDPDNDARDRPKRIAYRSDTQLLTSE